MTSQYPPIPAAEKSSGTVRALALAWLVAGTLDITVASIYYPLAYGIKLISLYQGIASGVLGRAAFSGGAGTAILGLTFHYTIALIWTVFFFLIFPRLKVMWKNRFLTAAAYGTFVSFAMTFVVLPLSNVHHSNRPLNVPHFCIDTIILMFTIGLPLSLIAGKHYAAASSRDTDNTKS